MFHCLILKMLQYITLFLVLDSQVCSWQDGDDKLYKDGEKQYWLKNNDVQCFCYAYEESCRGATFIYYVLIC